MLLDKKTNIKVGATQLTIQQEPAGDPERLLRRPAQPFKTITAYAWNRRALAQRVATRREAFRNAQLLPQDFYTHRPLAALNTDAVIVEQARHRERHERHRPGPGSVTTPAANVESALCSQRLSYPARI